jgi:hypothetical protein
LFSRRQALTQTALVEPILNELIASRPPAATSRFHPLSVLNLDGVLNGGETGFYVSLSDAATILSSNPHELNTNPTLALANSELSTWLDFMQAPTQSAPTTDDGVADISDAFHWAEQFLFNAGGITGNGNTAVVVMENVNLNPVSASSQEWLIGTDEPRRAGRRGQRRSAGPAGCRDAGFFEPE